jgi:hypothetical protein
MLCKILAKIIHVNMGLDKGFFLPLISRIIRMLGAEDLITDS